MRKEVEIMAENLVNTFVTQVIENSDYEELDRIYLTNKCFYFGWRRSC